MDHSSFVKPLAVSMLAMGLLAKSPAPIPTDVHAPPRTVLSAEEINRQFAMTGVSPEVGSVVIDQSAPANAHISSEQDAKNALATAQRRHDAEQAARVLQTAEQTIEAQHQETGTPWLMGLVMLGLGVAAAFGVKHWVEKAIPAPVVEPKKIRW